MNYNQFIESTQIPDEFDNNHKLFAQLIINLLLYNLNLDFNDDNHPFHRYADNDNRNEIVRNLEEDSAINNLFGEQMLVDFYRSDSIYHRWLQNMLDYYDNYAVEIGFYDQ